MAAHQAPPSLGFSRQEHWSGLPFPSPMHENEEWKWSRSVMPNSFATPWTVTYQALLSMGFPRQEYWSGLPLPSPGDLPDPGIKPASPTLQADFLPLRHQGSPYTLDSRRIKEGKELLVDLFLSCVLAFIYSFLNIWGTFLVVQWLRFCLPMQGWRFNPWSKS